MLDSIADGREKSCPAGDFSLFTFSESTNHLQIKKIYLIFTDIK